MTDADLASVAARLDAATPRFGQTYDPATMIDAVYASQADVEPLLAEVHRLRAALATSERGTQEGQSMRDDPRDYYRFY